ncbi:hypothetical protein bthur0014_21200 [Bacillus thuringiensis IBL 4222]|nr:hypothetical protein bthur0004_21500 [Bacillus thuringiensis serovar sotto str. T04001]EEN03289.1 hypothetical protein bthur0014_21200 [Bacillus thuringiensis IBL 4222]
MKSEELRNDEAISRDFKKYSCCWLQSFFYDFANPIKEWYVRFL